MMLDVTKWLRRLKEAIEQISDLVYAHVGRHKPGGADALFPADFSIEPATDNAYDLGKNTAKWRRLYVYEIRNVDQSNGERVNIEFIPQTYGCAIKIGGGSTTIIGAGEAADVVKNDYGGLDDENLVLSADNNIVIYTNLQSGWSAKYKNALFSKDGLNYFTSILPFDDNAYDLGKDTARWRNIHFSGVLYGGLISWD